MGKEGYVVRYYAHIREGIRKIYAVYKKAG